MESINDQPDLVAEPGSYADAIYFVRGFRRARSQLLTQWSDTHIKSDEGDCACTGLHVREAYNILSYFIPRLIYYVFRIVVLSFRLFVYKVDEFARVRDGACGPYGWWGCLQGWFAA